MALYSTDRWKKNMENADSFVVEASYAIINNGKLMVTEIP